MNMAGIPTGLMRMDTSDDGYADDDFFEIHTAMDPFQELLKNYTFALRYTGRRWYGQMEAAGMTSEMIVEEEYHGKWSIVFEAMPSFHSDKNHCSTSFIFLSTAFWNRAFSGVSLYFSVVPSLRVLVQCLDLLSLLFPLSVGWS